MAGNAPAGVFTLSQFTAAIGNSIRREPALQGAWVTAELSDVRVSGGHCYMELIEKNEAGQTVAKIRATVWASRYAYIRRKFLEATQREISAGMKVMVWGGASYHTLYGLSFTINDIEPSYTLGDMERLRREILQRLQREGILERNKSRQMPIAPQRIAVISAAGAAGYGDFIHQLSGNPEGFVFYPFLFPAVMQGERTSQSVCAALDFVEQTIDLWDCVAIVRGGGATTDLNGFDDYELARRVALFPLPVVVGIGHERDRTVLDEIGHTRLKTPTAVASFFIDSLRSAYSLACQQADSILRYTSDRLQGERQRVANLEAMVPVLARARIESAAARLDRETGRLPGVLESHMAKARGRLEAYGIRIEASADASLKRATARLDALEGMVGVLSPANTLKRGYTITRIGGKAVQDIGGIAPGSELETEFAGGKIKSRTI